MSKKYFQIITISLSIALTVPLTANGTEIKVKNTSFEIAQNSRLVEITGVNLVNTEKGLNLFIDTVRGANPEGEILDYDTYTIVKLNNTKLTLSGSRNFSKTNPIPGINLVSVTQSSENEVEIKIVGDKKLPKIEELPNSKGLLFTIIPEVTIAKEPTQPTEDTTSQNPEKTEETTEENIELTVVGTANPEETAPGTITVIDREQIQKQQARDIRDLIRYEPGVSVPNDSRGGLQGVNVRGLDGNRVNMQVDGIRLPSEYSYGTTRVGRDYVDIETLNSLEIFKGNNSAILNSDALGGTVNFNTANAGNLLDTLGKDSFTNARIQYSSKDTGVVGTITQANRFDKLDTLFIYTRRDRNEVQIGGGNSKYQDNQDINRNNFLGKVTYNFDKTSFLEFTGEYFNNVADTKFSLDNFPSLAFEGSTRALREEVTTDRTRFSLAYQLNNPDSKSWLQFARAIIYYQDAQIQEDSKRSIISRGAIQKEEADKELIDKVFGGNLQLRSDFKLGNINNRLTYGFDVSSTYNERNYLNFNVTTGARVNLPNFPQKDFPDSMTFRFGAFLQNEIALGDGKFKIIPGLRFDVYDLQAENNFEFTRKNQGRPAVDYAASGINPSLGLTYEISPGTTTFARYSRGFRPPLYDELNFAFRADIPLRPHKGIPNPDLETETSNNFELGLRSRSQQFDFGVTGFYNRYSNFIERSAFVSFDQNDFGSIPSGGRRIPFQVFQAQNIPDVEIYGVELKAAYRFSSKPGGLSIKSALGWQVGNDLTRDRTLASVGPLQAVVGLGYQSPTDKWGAEFIGTFVAKARELSLVDNQTSVVNGGVPTRKTDFYEPDGYALFDFIGYYNISRNLSLTAGVYNIFNTEYYQYADMRTIDARSATFAAQRGRYAQPGTNFAVGLSWKF
ncbi:TonB-dependent hemoglobin/transferrin/lactoferrin family receptor [Calothrix sp. PCC 6303]|uniref:TonB-dependent hemoglobin/transferrin/lactoferrin family receptor n=1 Tax=Calothrix sp. PCC 6303 TaxID=1170562 RepID=UPI0002A04BF8|nr:TonB-dependent hemoglobin/transferrin/lactoferrin family receptor [Calothrix sp. PCC 6303]AFZ02848.1 TonB-dependent hemoglobin/transferrin/lactoferrin family receptor [Calothrix sp. PCC 6303]